MERQVRPMLQPLGMGGAVNGPELAPVVAGLRKHGPRLLIVSKRIFIVSDFIAYTAAADQNNGFAVVVAGRMKNQLGLVIFVHGSLVFADCGPIKSHRPVSLGHAAWVVRGSPKP